MWFLPRNRPCLSARGPPPFHRWCIATILCVLKPHNVRSIAEREATSRNALSQMCTMFWCQSTSPGRLQCSRQAGEVLVKFQFKFVPYKSGFKNAQMLHITKPKSQDFTVWKWRQTINCALSLRRDLTTTLSSGFLAPLCFPPNLLLSFIFLYILYFQFQSGRLSLLWPIDAYWERKFATELLVFLRIKVMCCQRVSKKEEFVSPHTV